MSELEHALPLERTPRWLVYSIGQTVTCGVSAATALIVLHSRFGWPLAGAACLTLAVMFHVCRCVDALYRWSVPARGLPLAPLAAARARQRDLIICIPVIVRTDGNVSDLFAGLHARVNAWSTLDCTLVCLVDPADAPTKVTEADLALYARLHEGMEGMTHLTRETSLRVCMLVRERAYSADQAAYIAPDRKRGKINALCALVAGENDAFAGRFGDCSMLAVAKFMLLLDEDTWIDVQSVERLLAAACHPMSRAVVTRERGCGRVRDGFGIFVPNIVPLSADQAAASPGTSSGGWSGASEQAQKEPSLSFDIFGEREFTGKGLVDIAAFHQVIGHALPAERVLSHDILEGAWMRPAHVPSACIGEPEPSTFMARVKRQHRWMRGDWQNLFLMAFGSLRGCRIPPVSLTVKWVVFEQVSRHMAAIGAGLGLTAALTCGWHHAVGTVVFVLALTWAPIVLKALGPRSRGETERGLSSAQARRSLWEASVHFACLPLWSVVHIDALVRAMYRFLRGRRVLEWTSFIHSQDKGHG